MARIYYNVVNYGKDYSNLQLRKLDTRAEIKISSDNNSRISNTVQLNRDQISDLIVQLETIKGTLSPLIEGSI